MNLTPDDFKRQIAAIRADVTDQNRDEKAFKLIQLTRDMQKELSKIKMGLLNLKLTHSKNNSSVDLSQINDKLQKLDDVSANLSRARLDLNYNFITQ